MFAESEYKKFQHAFDTFNKELFESKLPQVFFTYARKKGAAGYFAPESYKARLNGETTHEIAMNPDAFRSRSNMEILSTLAHEMAHLWQHEFGTPPRRCYHDKEWGAKMDEIGLPPSSTGAEGGKRTGQRMSHYIHGGGSFEMVAQQLLAGGWRVDWEAVFRFHLIKSRNDKVKYVCHACNVKAWGKPGIRLICGECNSRMQSNV